MEKCFGIDKLIVNKEEIFVDLKIIKIIYLWLCYRRERDRMMDIQTTLIKLISKVWADYCADFEKEAL